MRTGLRALLAGSLLLTCAAQANGQQPSLIDAPKPAAPSEAALASAGHAMEQNHFDKAEALLRSYLARDESSPKARYLLAYSLLRQGKAKDALAEYTRAAALQKPSAEELRGVAQAYVLLNDYNDADKWLKLSLQMAPKSADTWYNLGRLRYTQNRFAEAVDCFQKVLELAPHSVKAENNLGLAYEGLSRTHEAEVAYRQAVAWQDAGPADAASEQPLLNLAILLLHGPDPAQARPLLLRAVAIAPREPRIHEQLGQLAMRESRFADAESEFKAAVGLAPGRSSLHFLLGQSYKHQGRQKEATTEFAEAARLSRVSPEDGSQ